MQLKTILNHIENFKGFVFSTARLCKDYDKWTFKEKSIVVEIRPRKNSKPICSVCNAPSAGYDSLSVRLFDYLPIFGILVYFAYKMRRVDCPRCGIKVEKVPWATGKSQITNSFAWYLAGWAKHLSWQTVANRFRVSWDSVYRAVEVAVNWGLDHRNLDNISSIGVDEISRSKGHKYLTVVYQIDKGFKRLLWIGNDRKEETFHGFFDWLGKEKTARLKAICSDMWKPYLKVIKTRADHVLHVLDRFHIVANINKAIDKVRAEESRKLKLEGYEPILTKTKWLLLRREENLTNLQKVSLKEILRYNLKTVRAYLLKEEFQLFWEYQYPKAAEKFLDNWCTKAMRSKIDPMKKMAKMIRSHRDLILNWFKAQKELSSGIVEGFNTKAKLTSRKSFGFRSVEVQKIALYHTLGDLPVPEWTHRFC